MILQLPTVGSRPGRPAPREGIEAPARPGFACRLVQVALAIYLLPVLLLVMVMGGVGMLLAAVIRPFLGPPHDHDGSLDALVPSIPSGSRGA